LPSFHGGLLEVSLELGTVRPTFLVTSKDSPPALAEATDLLAQVHECRRNRSSERIPGGEDGW
jgi:hypothetical protein